MSDLGDVKRVMAGTTALQYGGLDTIHQLTDIVVNFTKSSADSMATDATTVGVFWTNPFDFPLKVVGAKLVSASTLTASDSHYATISIQVDDGANGAPAVAASWATTTTGTGNWAADTAESATITAANAVVAAGACLHFAIAKTGNGVAVPVSYYSIRLQRAE
jgi:hypothetical protein